MFRVAIRAVPRLVKQKPTFQQQRTVLAVNLSKDNGKREKVVILGSGWAANKLLQDIDKKRYEVSIISPRNHFLFTPLLPSTTVGTLDFRSIVEPMRSSKKHPEWNFFQAACLDIDANTKTLTCEERAVRESEHRVFKLNYDKLVVTIGADNNTYNIPGVQENTYFLKELDDARKIRQKIIECFERASIPGTSGEERSKLLNFVIVGGGPTGVEFAGELSDFFWEDLRHYFPTIPVNEVRFTLVEASTTILGAFHKALVDHAMVTIKRQGVDIRTHSLVKEVRKNEIHLADGTVIPCGLIVWSTGVGPRDLAKKLGWQKTKQGRFIVDDHLRVKELKDVYAAGDCAEIEANPLPATAQVAQQQGRYIAKAFNTMAKDPQATVDPFKFHYLGITTYVGSNKSLIDMDTVQMSGLIAWLGWRSAYLTRLGSWRNKLMVPLNWTRTMLFGRDISNF